MKDIKTIIHECELCMKTFHPGCAVLHKTFNAHNQLVPCTAKMKVTVLTNDNEKSDKNGQGNKRKRLEERNAGETMDQDRNEDETNGETVNREKPSIEEKLDAILRTVSKIDNKWEEIEKFKEDVKTVVRHEIEQFKQKFEREFVYIMMKKIGAEIDKRMCRLEKKTGAITSNSNEPETEKKQQWVDKWNVIRGEIKE